MYSKVIPNEELTQATFGYKIEDLPKGSHKKVVVECTNCNRIIHREKRNILAKHRCPAVVGNNKRCFKCKKWKDLSLFNKNPKTSGGVAKMCRSCYNSHDSVKKCEARRNHRLKLSIENNDIEFYIQRRTYSIKTKAIRNNIAFDLDSKFLIELWNSQEGNCFYTGIPMKNSMKNKGFQSWDAPSLDRINPNKGYIKPNVVWCIFGVNSFKQSLTIEEFKKSVSKIIWRFPNDH